MCSRESVVLSDRRSEILQTVKCLEKNIKLFSNSPLIYSPDLNISFCHLTLFSSDYGGIVKIMT